LFYHVESDDILLVQINPIERRPTPHTGHEIQNRLSEITFNSGLLGELRAIDFVVRLIDQGKLSRDEYKRVLMHRVHGGAQLDAFTASSRLNASWGFFQQLRDLGRECAYGWLDRHYADLGERGTLDLRRAYS
jgi:NTE family protein